MKITANLLLFAFIATVYCFETNDIRYDNDEGQAGILSGDPSEKTLLEFLAVKIVQKFARKCFCSVQNSPLSKTIPSIEFDVAHNSSCLDSARCVSTIDPVAPPIEESSAVLSQKEADHAVFQKTLLEDFKIFYGIYLKHFFSSFEYHTVSSCTKIFNGFFSDTLIYKLEDFIDARHLILAFLRQQHQLLHARSYAIRIAFPRFYDHFLAYADRNTEAIRRKNPE